MGPEVMIAALSGAATSFGIAHKVHTKGQARIENRFEKIERDLSTFKHDVFHDYVLKEDFLREMQAVHNKLDRILDYLIQTANK